ncbi:MAG: hypothetical protein ACR2LM_14180 [Pyrinomonadaceae bacterium]
MTRLRLAIISGAVFLLFSACGGALYKVKPVVELPPLKGDLKSASGGGVSVVVAPLLSDEDSQGLFEANLPLAGVLPVRIELNYESGVPVEIKKSRFSLRDETGKDWKLLTPKQAISRVLKANEVYAYNPNSRKQFEAEFSAYGLDVKTPLSPTDRRRQGFLFFQTPDKEAVATPRGLVLMIDRLPQPLQISIN